MSLSRADLEQLAPDQASLAAARGLLKPAKWPLVGREADGSMLFGECQGSGATPYRVCVSAADRGYKCSCPSRKFPCKHVLALVWLAVEEPARFAIGARPEWVREWESRRRGKPAGPAVDRAPPSVELATTASEASPDPQAEQRAAAARERNRRQREAQITAGCDDLDTWIGDQLARGFAAFAGVARDQCRLIASRLADAKATGLATALDGFAARLLALPDAERLDCVTEALGGLHLLAAAWRRVDSLPSALQAEVRQRIGFALDREALLQREGTLRVAGQWVVAGRRRELEPGRLYRHETWMLRRDVPAGDADPSCALLLDYTPQTAGAAGPAFAVGESFVATLAFHPAATPLRAIIAERAAETQSDQALPIPPLDLAAALAACDADRERSPWSDLQPIAAREVEVAEAIGGGLWLVDAARMHGLPLDRAQEDAAYPLVGVGPIAAFALWDGRRAVLLCAETALGPWRAA